MKICAVFWNTIIKRLSHFSLILALVPNFNVNAFLSVSQNISSMSFPGSNDPQQNLTTLVNMFGKKVLVKDDLVIIDDIVDFFAEYINEHVNKSAPLDEVSVKFINILAQLLNLDSFQSALINAMQKDPSVKTDLSSMMSIVITLANQVGDGLSLMYVVGRNSSLNYDAGSNQKLKDLFVNAIQALTPYFDDQSSSVVDESRNPSIEKPSSPVAAAPYELKTLSSILLPGTVSTIYGNVASTLASYETSSARSSTSVPMYQNMFEKIGNVLNVMLEQIEKPDYDLAVDDFSSYQNVTQVTNLRQLMDRLLYFLGNDGPFYRDLKITSMGRGISDQSLYDSYSDLCSKLSQFWAYEYVGGVVRRNFDSLISTLDQKVYKGIFSKKMDPELVTQASVLVAIASQVNKNTTQSLLTLLRRLADFIELLNRKVQEVVSHSAGEQGEVVDPAIDEWFKLGSGKQALSYRDGISLAINVLSKKGPLFRDIKMTALGRGVVTQAVYDAYAALVSNVLDLSFFQYVNQSTVEEVFSISTSLGSKGASSDFSKSLPEALKKKAKDLLVGSRKKTFTTATLSKFIEDFDAFVKNIENELPASATSVVLCDDVWFDPSMVSKTIDTLRDAISFIVNVVIDGGVLYKNIKISSMGAGLADQSLKNLYSGLCKKIKDSPVYKYVDGKYALRIDSMAKKLAAIETSEVVSKKLDSDIVLMADKLLRAARTKQSKPAFGPLAGIAAQWTDLLQKINGMLSTDVLNSMPAGSVFDCTRVKWFGSSINKVIILHDLVSMLVAVILDKDGPFYRDIQMSGSAEASKTTTAKKGFFDKLKTSVTNAVVRGLATPEVYNLYFSLCTKLMQSPFYYYLDKSTKDSCMAIVKTLGERGASDLSVGSQNKANLPGASIIGSSNQKAQLPQSGDTSKTQSTNTSAVTFNKKATLDSTSKATVTSGLYNPSAQAAQPQNSAINTSKSGSIPPPPPPPPPPSAKASPSQVKPKVSTTSSSARQSPDKELADFVMLQVKFKPLKSLAASKDKDFSKLIALLKSNNLPALPKDDGDRNMWFIRNKDPLSAVFQQYSNYLGYVSADKKVEPQPISRANVVNDPIMKGVQDKFRNVRQEDDDKDWT